MSKTNVELINRIRGANKEYKRIESLLTPLGFTLCGKAVFYGKIPFNIYCGEMKNYQSFIDNIDSIKKNYLEHKKKCQRIY